MSRHRVRSHGSLSRAQSSGASSGSAFLRRSNTEIRREGFVFRESGYVDGVVNQRYGTLYPEAFVTFRQQDADQPTKVWPLSGRCRITGVECREFMVRGKHANTLFTLVSGHYEKKQLHSFRIFWPSGHFFGGEHLRLCFEDQEDANAWRQAVAEACLELLSVETPSRTPSTSSLGQGPSNTSRRRKSFQERLMPRSQAQVVPLDKSISLDLDSLGPLKNVRASRSHEDLSATATPTSTLGGAETPPQQLARRRRWAAVRHVNGVAVYQEDEDEDGGGGATMVSCIVRSCPEAVFKALMDIEQNNQFMFPFYSAAVLEQLDPQTRVLRGRLRAAGMTSCLCAPREVVVQQNWRQDDDGTYIVLMQSTHHARAHRDPGSWYSWYHPIRSQVMACGYTIAPLSAKFTQEGVSNECLVTLIAKVDLGGWLSTTGPGSAAAFRRWMRSMHFATVNSLVNSYLEPVLLSVITLRDRVEQERFVVKPFSLGQQNAAEQYKMEKQARLDTGMRRSSLPTPEVAAANGESEDREFGSVPVEPEILHTLSPTMWSCPGSAGFKVRGRNYLKDRKKIKAEEPVFALMAAELIEVDEPCWNISQYLPCIRNNTAPFTLVLNFVVPGPPEKNLVMAWSCDYDPTALNAAHSANGSTAGDESDADASGLSPFDISLARFLEGDGPEATKMRSSRFKLIPSIAVGSWIIKQAVGSTPVLLGNKLQTRYFRGPNYFEVSVDVTSSYAAASVVNLVKGATKSLAVDFAVVIEGQSAEELPERLLGTVRFSNLDMDSGAYLNQATGTLHWREPEEKLQAQKRCSSSICARKKGLKSMSLPASKSKPE